MNYYKEPVLITEPVGNNAISFDERKLLGSEGKIYVPAIISGVIDNVVLGDKIVFEEVNDGKLVSCAGLQALVMCTHHDVPVCIMDNHNHALYFRYQAFKLWVISPWVALIHIDQHADMNEPAARIDEARVNDLSYVAEYVNTQTQIASFIKPALQSGLVSECIQVRSEAKLQEIADFKLDGLSYILDIDIDFFAHETDVSWKIELIRKLMRGAALVTIATSPSFIDQKRALELVRMLLS